MSEDRIEIMTIPGARTCVKECTEVLINIRFGTYDTRVKISKKEAMMILDKYPNDSEPGRCEMYGGSFGYMEDGAFYMG